MVKRHVSLNGRPEGAPMSMVVKSVDRPEFFDATSVQTQTIDLDSLFSADLTESGSFDVRGAQKTAFGRLLDAFPLPAALLDDADSVLFSNESFAKVCPDRTRMCDASLSSIFVRPRDQEKFAACLSDVRIHRKPQVMEAILGSKNAGIWGRIHMRSVRMGSDRYILMLVEDLTAEKKQAVLSEKYAESMRKARDELEMRVNERTADLLKANEDLRREISVRKRAQKRLSLAARVISSVNEAILITDAQANIVHVNEAFCQITGYTREEVIGKNPKIMASGRQGKEFWARFWSTLLKTGYWKGEVWDRRANGEVFPKLLHVSAIRLKGGDVTHYVGIFSDISKLKQSEERLENLAHYDPLTQLPNRLLFRDRLRQALIRAGRAEKLVALMFVDLDGFKNLNDTRGHPRGDELLVAVAERLTQCVRLSDTVARLGGDEFTVVMPDLSDERGIVPVAHRIIDSLSRPFSLGGDELFTSASIGISVYPANGLDADTLLKQADTAMYHAKAQGKNNFQFFSAQMNKSLTRMVGMEVALRRAMETNGLLLHYQPVVDARTGRVTSTEALLRMTDPLGRVISAGPYVPVAEEKGLIVPIGEWVLRTACKQHRLWKEAGHTDVRMAVNVSMRQLRKPDLVSSFLKVIEETGYDPKLLELELTESSIMENPRRGIEMLNEFRRHGILVTIDDFGTGYSSLSRLRNLPVDKLKIDRSFLGDLANDPTQRALIQAMVTVAHSLDMQVVAEGVESKEQLETLCKIGCDALQGYYFSPAIPAEEFERLLLPRAWTDFHGQRRGSMHKNLDASPWNGFKTGTESDLRVPGGDSQVVELA